MRRGSTAVAILAIYYVSPLTTLAKVLRRRDSSSLHKPMLVANIGNGLLWFAYGLATRDWFLIMPNGIGAAFSFLSLGISFCSRRLSGMSVSSTGRLRTLNRSSSSSSSRVILEASQRMLAEGVLVIVPLRII
jgi:hypothetical protein